MIRLLSKTWNLNVVNFLAVKVVHVILREPMAFVTVFKRPVSVLKTSSRIDLIMNASKRDERSCVSER